MGSVALEGFGNGGAALNFAVKQYDSEAQLLAATPKKNTIGIISDTKMTGWVIDVNQPDNPTEGLVWICTGTSSTIEFNALKRNGIQVYLISAKQYVSGVWANVAASVYQDSAWSVFSAKRYYLFKSGEGPLVSIKTYNEAKSTITVGTDEISITCSDDEINYVTALRTNGKIDLSEYTSACMECKPSKRLNADYATFGVTSTAFTTADPGTLSWVAKTAISASTSKKTITVDLSKVSKSLYVAFVFGGTMSVENIWLE